jgi:hypothetical protein
MTSCNQWNSPMESTETRGRNDDIAMEEEQSREDDDDVDDGRGDKNDTVCNWYTRQKNQPSLTKSMPLPPTTDTS